MTLNRFAQVLAGASDGHYELPAPVVEALAVLNRAQLAQAAVTPPYAASKREAFTERILAAPTLADLPDAHALVELEATERAYHLWSVAVRDALDIAEQRLVDALVADIDSVITNCLRPAHSAAVEAARRHAPMSPLVAAGPAALAALNGDQRDAADELAQATARYGATRAAWGEMIRANRQPRADLDNVFGELRDLPTVWSSYRQRGNDAPWPVDPVLRLVWIAHHASPWLPTPSEQQERFLEVYGDAIDQAAHNREQMRGLAAVFQ